MIIIKNDRRVYPSNYKIANQFENKTGTIDFDLSCLNYEGNKYLICKYQGDNDFKKPLLLDENNSVPVLTFLSAKSGVYQCVLVISSAAIDENYDFSTDNPLFVSNVFSIYVDENFLTGTSTAWDLPPAMQNKFDELIALIDKVNEDLESGAFDGNGIENIEKTSSNQNIDSYTINYTDGSTSTFTVTNGLNGKDGTDGITPNIQIGTVTTLEPNQQATVERTGTDAEPVFNFGIPKGEKGDNTSDNILIGTVPKQENPSIDDGWEAPLRDLVLYGKSTQEADPSPSDPKEITSIDKVDLSICGKNLFDVDKAKNTENYKLVNVSGVNLMAIELKLEKNTTYYVSCKATSPAVNINICSTTARKSLKTSNIQSIATNENGILYFGFVGSAVDVGVFDSQYTNIQIEKNSFTSYEPYIEPQTLSLTPPQPLYSTLDGSIADEVDVDKGVYRYNLKKTTFDKTQMSNVKYQTATNSGYSVFAFNLSQDLISDRKVNSAVLCNILQGLNKGIGTWYTDKLNVISGDSASKNVFYANVSSEIITPEQFLSLFENNVEFGFALEIPTEQPIHQEDLQKLKALKNYTGVTNILCNAPVSFNYEQSLQIVINKLINKVGANTISVKALESEVINNV